MDVGSLWWERFIEKVCFSLEWKHEGVVMVRAVMMKQMSCHT